MNSMFISHSWKDKPLARRIGNALSAAGVRVWIDEASIKIGDSLIGKIREGIDETDFLVALISKNSIDSEWVTKELDIAMNQEIKGKSVKVLPVLLDDSPLPIRFTLDDYYINYIFSDGDVDGMVRLCSTHE